MGKSCTSIVVRIGIDGMGWDGTFEVCREREACGGQNAPKSLPTILSPTWKASNSGIIRCDEAQTGSAA